MQPLGPVRLSNAVLTLPRASALISNWQVGQIVAATVASRPQSGHVTLRIGNQLVQAQTANTGLQQGQKLELQIVDLGRVPSLRVLTTGASDAVRTALRSALPRQQPVSTVLAELVRITARPADTQPAVANMARTVLARVPQQTQLTNSEGLRQAVRDSGHFLESRIASSTDAPPDLSRDLKANLLRLLNVLRQSAANIGPENKAQPQQNSPARQSTPSGPAADGRNVPPAAARNLAPGQATSHAARPVAATTDATPLPRLNLVEQTEASLARIRVNQLSSTTPERPLTPEWLLEIPVRRGEQLDTWHFHIQQDADGTGDDQTTDRNWSVVLRFNLPGMGPMEARVGLSGDTVSTIFAAEQENILPVLEEHFPHLRSRLEEQGLDVAHLACHQGDISLPMPSTESGGLVDEKA